MGTKIIKTIFPCLYNAHQNQCFNVMPIHSARPLTQQQNDQITVILISQYLSQRQYLAGIGDLCVHIKVLVCDDNFSQQMQIYDETVYGLAKSYSGQIFYKKRILFQNLNLGIAKFAQKKLLSELGIGERISKIFDFDIQVYLNFLEYAAEIPVRKDNLPAQQAEERLRYNINKLNSHNIKMNSYKKSISLHYKKIIIEYSPLIQSQYTKSNYNVPKQNKEDKELFQQSIQKILKNHQMILLQAARPYTKVLHHLNKLENNIYLKNYETEKIIRDSTERELLHNTEIDIKNKYYKGLEKYYSATGRTEEQKYVLKILLKQPISNSQRQLYSDRIALLQMNQLAISSCIQEYEGTQKAIQYYHVLSHIKLQQKQNADALRIIEKSCRLHNYKSNQVYIESAQILFRQGFSQKAINLLKEGVALGCKLGGNNYLNNSNCFHLLGLIYLASHNFEMALKAFEVCLKIFHQRMVVNDIYFNCINNMICLLQRNGNIREAQKLFSEFFKQRNKINNHKQSVKIYSNMAAFMFKLGRMEDAKKIFTQCIKQIPSINMLNSPVEQIKVYSNLACYEMRKKDYKKAEQYLDIAIQKQKKLDSEICIQLHNNLAMVYYLQTRYQKALNEYTLILKVLQVVEDQHQLYEFLSKQNHLQLNYNIGMCHKKIHKLDDALIYFLEAQRYGYMVYNFANKITQKIKAEIEDIKAQRIQQLSSSQEQSQRNMSELKDMRPEFRQTRQYI